MAFGIPLLLLLALLQVRRLPRRVHQRHQLITLESRLNYASRPNDDPKMSGIELGGCQGLPDLVYENQMITWLKVHGRKCRKVGLISLVSTINFLKLVRRGKHFIFVLNHVVLHCCYISRIFPVNCVFFYRRVAANFYHKMKQ